MNQLAGFRLYMLDIDIFTSNACKKMDAAEVVLRELQKNLLLKKFVMVSLQRWKLSSSSLSF